jgi:hypothetical protein
MAQGAAEQENFTVQNCCYEAVTSSEDFAVQNCIVENLKSMMFWSKHFNSSLVICDSIFFYDETFIKLSPVCVRG